MSNVIYNIFEEPQVQQEEHEITPVDGFAADSIFDYFSAEEWENQAEKKVGVDHEVLKDEAKNKEKTDIKKENDLFKNTNNVIIGDVKSKATNGKEEVMSTQKPNTDLPRMGFPDTENQRKAQSQEKQGVNEGQATKKPNNGLSRMGFPDPDFRPQLNTKELNTSTSKAIHTIPTRNAKVVKEKKVSTVCQPQKMDAETKYAYVRNRLCDNMNYYVLCQEYQKERVDVVLEVMLDIFFQTASTVRISKEEMRPIGIVRKVFLALREEQVRAVLEALIHPRSKIYNHRKFILAMLYRSMSLSVLDNYEVRPICQENVVRSDLGKNLFHNFSQGEYDITELEKILIKNY